MAELDIWEINADMLVKVIQNCVHLCKLTVRYKITDLSDNTSLSLHQITNFTFTGDDTIHFVRLLELMLNLKELDFSTPSKYSSYHNELLNYLQNMKLEHLIVYDYENALNLKKSFVENGELSNNLKTLTIRSGCRLIVADVELIMENCKKLSKFVLNKHNHAEIFNKIEQNGFPRTLLCLK